MKTTSWCASPDCDQATAPESRLCAFHQLAENDDIFSGLVDDLGGIPGADVLEMVFQLMDEAGAAAAETCVETELRCGHGLLFGGCYLTMTDDFPGLSRTTWEQRASAYSWGIPLS